jgi:TonB-linked SusC/RagA family outer membrane protein
MLAHHRPDSISQGVYYAFALVKTKTNEDMNIHKPIQGFLIVFMKILLTQALILTVFTVCTIASDLKGQEVLKSKLSIKANDKEIKKVLSEIERKTQVRFTYSSAVVNVNRQISVDFKDQNLASVLEGIFASDIRYEVRGNRIILKPANAFASGEKPGIVNKGERYFAVQVSGKITDEKGGPLPGANILEKGTTNGTTADVNGEFSLSVMGESSVLTFSFIGYTSQEVSVGSRTSFSIQLEPDLRTLNEVIVVGYGTVKKSDLTGSVSSVKAEELTAYPAIDAVQALQGRAAGVNITANNGAPGATMKIRIRGGTSINASSDPIFVVDGLIGGAVPPPEDIESIEVLKDASATSIYGSRGANGVIMVTTKKGKPGKMQISLNTSLTAQHEINRLDLLNADQFTDYILEARPDFVPQGFNTDWQDQIFRTGVIQNYQLSLSGGNENVSYYISGAYFDQQGVIINSDYDRFSLTTNLNIKASEKLNIGLNLFARRNAANGVRTQEGSGGLTPGVVASAFKFEPDQGIYNADGSYTIARLNDPHDNPYAVATELENESISDRFQANVFGEYAILKDLKFRTSFGATTNNRRAGTYSPTSLSEGRSVGGWAAIDGAKSTLLLNENYLTYNKSFSETDNFTAMVGYSFQTSSDERWGAETQNLLSDAFSFWNLGGSSVWQAPESGLTEWQISSYYGRLNYSLNDRYMFTFNARYDGSSNFSKGNKWAFFPSGAVAWNMKNEPFMGGVDAISFWKWRVSYGITGNQAISPYETMAKFSPVFAVIGGAPVNAVRPTAVANNDLSWETTAQLNLGADIGLFNDRLSLTAEYYRMVTSDLLFEVALPEYSGYTSQLKNLGEVENKGVELTLSSRNLDRQLKWNMDINFSANRNKVLSLPDGNDIQYGSAPGHLVGLDNTQILREGYPVGSFWGWIYDGVYQQGDDFIEGGGFEQVAGGEKFRDIDGIRDANDKLTGQPDGTLSSSDQAIIGNPHPDFIWGWNNDLRFKNFDLNIFFQGSQGNDVLSYTLMELNLLNSINNATTVALDRWTPTHTDTDVPMASTGRSRRISTRWIYDGSFVRLKNLSLGYAIPKPVLDRLHLTKFRIYVSAQNILTFTKYEGYDPEVNYNSEEGADTNRNLGLDYGSYPNAKSYTVGLNIGF